MENFDTIPKHSMVGPGSLNYMANKNYNQLLVIHECYREDNENHLVFSLTDKADSIERYDRLIRRYFDGENGEKNYTVHLKLMDMNDLLNISEVP